MRKKVIAGMILILGISSIGFSGGRTYGRKDRYNKHNRYERYDRYNRYDRDRYEKERKYEQIYSKYSRRISSLEYGLKEKEREIKREKSHGRPDWRKIDRLTAEKNFIKKDLDSVYSDFRKEISRNNLSAYAPRR